ncbi:hypothetical protein MKX01_036474 [Papaver californicum]|nr:hypothetical protein MKX01_036474 [Papaver californicum]
MDVERVFSQHSDRAVSNQDKGISFSTFKDKLLSLDNFCFNNEWIFLNDITKDLVECEITSESDEDVPTTKIPSIDIDFETRKKICQKWKWCIIGKVQGKTVGFKFLHEKVNQLWKLSAPFNMLDPGRDFFLFKFGNLDDYKKVVFGSPWFISGHFLNLQRWSPNFRLSTAIMEKTVVWFRIPELPLEYFDKDILFKIGNILEHTINFELTTEQVARGRFARVCVEIETSKPLIPCIRIGGSYQKIEYEGLNQVCFRYWKVSHKQNNCGHDSKGSEEMNFSSKNENTQGVQVNVNKKNDNFGPWMLVEDRRKKKMGNVEATRGSGIRLRENNISGKADVQGVWIVVSRKNQGRCGIHGQTGSGHGAMQREESEWSANRFVTLQDQDGDGAAIEEWN